MTTTRNLWGDLPDLKTAARSPAVILEEQGVVLARLTKNILSGEVIKRPKPGRYDEIEATFYIVAQLLDEYRYSVCSVIYEPASLYPAGLVDLVAGEREAVNCNSEEELSDSLGRLLSSDKVQRVVVSLIRESGVDELG